MHCPFKIDPSEIKVSDPAAVRRRLAQAAEAYALAQQRKAEEARAAALEAQRRREVERRRIARLVVSYRTGLTSKQRAHQIVEEIADKHSLRVNDLTGDSRMHPIVIARQEAMYEIRRQLPSFSTSRIGHLLGRRDHTTALHGIQAHAKRNGLQLEGAVV
ncbi:helix-turn-helix domain-containing protein [Labrys sp. KB_33_2]|uniref:helix-turn-helix domain-containing protein n=1 Tax=Labrys sp. KB_33_2 TaxID=3237479 RepID=UPI003F8F17F8